MCLSIKKQKARILASRPSMIFPDSLKLLKVPQNWYYFIQRSWVRFPIGTDLQEKKRLLPLQLLLFFFSLLASMGRVVDLEAIKTWTAGGKAEIEGNCSLFFVLLLPLLFRSLFLIVEHGLQVCQTTTITNERNNVIFQMVVRSPFFFFFSFFPLFLSCL